MVGIYVLPDFWWVPKQASIFGNVNTCASKCCYLHLLCSFYVDYCRIKDHGHHDICKYLTL